MIQIIKSIIIEIFTLIRELKINPNKYSRIKIEEFTMSLSQELTIGKPCRISMTDQPDTTIRAQVVTSNVPCIQFIFIDEIKAANISALLAGKEDAYNYSIKNTLRKLDLPTITPANRIVVLGEYTGLIPKGFNENDKFIFTMSFKGPATLCD